MYAGFIASLLLDQIVVMIVTHGAPQAIADSPRWFSVLAQPWSSLLAIILVFLLMKSTRSLWLGLVLGGAVSNLITFLAYRHAIDYLPLPLGITTNLADLLIIMGLVGVAVIVISNKKDLPD